MSELLEERREVPRSSLESSTPPRGEPRHSALTQLTLVRFREFLREPEAVFWTFIFPILLATGLGIAFRSRPAEVVKIGVLSTAPYAERVRQALAADSALDVAALDDSAAASALRVGSVALVVVPRDSTGVEYRFDEARTEARTARLVVDRSLQRAMGRRDALAVEESLISEPGSRYIDFVIPGLLGMNLMGGGIWGIGFAIVDARRKKLLKRFVATPMSRSQFLFSFLLMRLSVMLVEVAVVTAFAVLAFRVPMRGSVLLFSGTCLLATLTFGSLGLLIASRAKTIEGASGLMNLVMVPMWLGSGVFFSSANFPDAVQPFVQALPLTAIVDGLRGVMLQGAGWQTVGVEWAIAGAWLVVSFFLALRLFRWR